MSSEALKPCPFCGSPKIDPEGWLRGDGVSGPACDDCGASAESVARWNKRAFEPVGFIAEAIAERRRQIDIEGWTPDHDDEHRGGEIALAAGCYALASTGAPRAAEHWPWDGNWWKPKDRRSDLVRAVALLIAESERLDRLGEKAKQEGA